MVEVLLLLLAYALMLDRLLRMAEPVPVARRAFLRLVVRELMSKRKSPRKCL